MSRPKLPIGEKCYRCRKNAELRERDDNGIWTGKYVCKKHYHEDYQKMPDSQSNIIKSLRDRRIGNLDPYSEKAKGDMGEELLCKWKGYTNLNKKYDNYNARIDCLDEKTGLYYQVKVSYYDPISKYWGQNFVGLQNSFIQEFRFKSLFLFCITKDGKNVERIYEIPEKEVIKRSSISIYKYSRCELFEGGWYRKYRIFDEKDLKNVNDIYGEILKSFK